MTSSRSQCIVKVRSRLAQLVEELRLADSMAEPHQIDRKMEALEAYLADLLAGPEDS